MNRKSHRLFYIFGALIILFVLELFYISLNKSISTKERLQKNQFVSLLGLPDLAIVTEAFFVRHRSLANIFTIYSDDPSLIEYFPSTFVYSHSHIINQEKIIEK
jgi:ABC-type sugar transport system permease subunit